MKDYDMNGVALHIHARAAVVAALKVRSPLTRMELAATTRHTYNRIVGVTLHDEWQDGVKIVCVGRCKVGSGHPYLWALEYQPGLSEQDQLLVEMHRLGRALGKYGGPLRIPHLRAGVLARVAEWEAKVAALRASLPKEKAYGQSIRIR